MARIQAKDAILKLSLDGTTYKEVICEIGNTYNRERTVNVSETKCYGGTSYASLGAKSGTIDFTGIFETQPGGTQVSAEEINDYFENGTYLYWKLETPSGGADRYRQGRGYVTSLTEDAQIANDVTIDFTLTMDGDVDIAV